ncbi:MAG: serine/threonine protein kinase, partial [Syntrophobacteraceae bacterium]
AAVTRHPNDPNIWGLKNLSSDKWVVTKPGNSTLEIVPGRSLAMAIGTRVNFGNREGEIRL